MLTLKNMTRKSVLEIELKRVDVLRQIKANKPKASSSPENRYRGPLADLDYTQSQSKLFEMT